VQHSSEKDPRKGAQTARGAPSVHKELAMDTSNKLISAERLDEMELVNYIN